MLLPMFYFGRDISTTYINFSRYIFMKQYLISCNSQFMHERDTCQAFNLLLNNNYYHFVQQEEKKRAALVARANQAQDEDLGWGDEGLCTPKEYL